MNVIVLMLGISFMLLMVVLAPSAILFSIVSIIRNVKSARAATDVNERNQYRARVFSYSLLLAGALWVFILVIYMFTR